MENNGILTVRQSAACDAVTREVIGFFKANPFLLVTEGRLAALLCRPPEMVCEAVHTLEAAGLLKRRYGDALLGVEESLAEADVQ